MNQHFDFLTPYELCQRTKVLLSFVHFFGRDVLLHVRLIRGSAERCDTQRLDKVVHGSRGRAIVCFCDGSDGRV